MQIPVKGDTRYRDIGDLPTGGKTYSFDRVYLRPFHTDELSLQHYAMNAKTRPHQHILQSVQAVCNVDIDEMTDGDLCYIMAWLRRQSFPEVGQQAKYTCYNMLYQDGEGAIYRVSAAEAKRKGYVLKPCGRENVNLIKETEVLVKTLEDDDLVIQHPEIDFPRVATLTDYHEYVDENEHMKYIASLARWCKKGSSFKAKLAYFQSQKDFKLWDDIELHQKKYFHGIIERIRLRCSDCNHVTYHESTPCILRFFPSYSDKDVYNMTYNMMAQMGATPNPQLPSKMFMYLHSQLVDDRRKAEAAVKEKQRQQRRY